jgi:hypothetical protein
MAETPDLTGLPTTAQWQKMLTDHVDDMTEVINMVESQRGLLKDYRREVAYVEGRLSEALVRERSLRLELRQLASRWSRATADEGCGRTNTDHAWLQAAAQLTATLDADQ